METPSLTSLAINQLSLRRILEEGLIGESNPFSPQVLQQLQSRFTLETLYNEGLLEGDLDLNVLVLAFQELDPIIGWCYFRDIFTLSQSQVETNSIFPSETPLTSNFEFIDHYLDLNSYTLTAEEAVEQVYIAIKEDILAILTYPYKLISINGYTFAWVYYDTGYELYDDTIIGKYRPIQAISIAEILNMIYTNPRVNSRVTEPNSSIIVILPPYELDARQRAILGFMGALDPNASNNLLDLLNRGTFLRITLDEFALRWMQGVIVAFMVGPSLFWFKSGELRYLNPEDSLLAINTFIYSSAVGAIAPRPE